MCYLLHSRGSHAAVIPMDESLSVSSSNFFQWTPFPSAYHLPGDQRVLMFHLVSIFNSLEVLHHRVVVYPSFQLLSHTRWAVPTLTDHLSRPCAPCSHDEPWCRSKRCDGFGWMRWISRHENNDALLLVVAAEKKKSTELHRGGHVSSWPDPESDPNIPGHKTPCLTRAWIRNKQLRHLRIPRIPLLQLQPVTALALAGQTSLSAQYM
jgi:hypothetical protein